MSKLAIEKLSAAQPAPLQRLENVFEHVRKRAFELFEQRGGETGKDLQDWLNAEQEIVFSPPSELVEEDSCQGRRESFPPRRSKRRPPRRSEAPPGAEGEARPPSGFVLW
jgi:hypothetical protein